MPPAPTAAPPPHARSGSATPNVIILGSDALLAARPATPGQLVNACYAAGYSAVIPASWGDELVAARCLREIASRGQESVVLCTCPRVEDQLRRVPALASQLLPLIAPPVAAARYLRARAGRHGVHITYVGDCPGATDPAIDRHATPAALLRGLAKRGIDPVAQPQEVEERLLRDRRRFYSLPGGAPAPNWLYLEKRGYTMIEPVARDYLAEVAFRVSRKERRIVDLAPRLGCSCSGAVAGEPWGQARARVTALEPPRAVHEVVDHDVPVDVTAEVEPWMGSAADGERTAPIPLETLASEYDPDAKGATVRSAQPARRPRRSAAVRPAPGARSGEPLTVPRATPRAEPRTAPLIGPEIQSSSQPSAQPPARPRTDPYVEPYAEPFTAPRARATTGSSPRAEPDSPADSHDFFRRTRPLVVAAIVCAAAVGLVLALSVSGHGPLASAVVRRAARPATPAHPDPLPAGPASVRAVP